MVKIKDISDVNTVVNLSLWGAIKLRIAGIVNYITDKKDEKAMDEVDEMVAGIREIARKSEQAVEKSVFEEKLAKIEDRLDFYERTESLKAPNWGKPELLLEMLKVIADTYATGEVDEAIQLLRDEIPRQQGTITHYRGRGNPEVEVGDDLL